MQSLRKEPEPVRTLQAVIKNRFSALLALVTVLWVFFGIPSALAASFYQPITGFAIPGKYPVGSLVYDGAGNYWGTTIEGGVDLQGSVFKVNVSTGAIITVVNFDYSTSTNDNQRGAFPAGALISDGAGNLWGTTPQGGVTGYGTLFKINVSTGVITTVIDFDNSSSPADEQRGGEPDTALYNDGAGNLWGTTLRGGTGGGQGTIFKINIADGAIDTIADFDNTTSTSDNVRGAQPNSVLISDGAGDLWGTTMAGGRSGFGSVFELNTFTGAVVTPFDFDASPSTTDNQRGKDPGPLTPDGAGNLWGTTSGDGAHSFGTVYKINLSGTTITTLDDFDDSETQGDNLRGSQPFGGLASDGAGYLWGTTSVGGISGAGTVFKVNISTGAVTAVLDFDGSQTPGDNLRGSGPAAELVSDGAGNFWGSTTAGGVGNLGTVFKINISTGKIVSVTDIDTYMPLNPTGDLFNDGAGFLWGTTYEGGGYSVGTVYKTNIATGAVTTLASFDYSSSTSNNERGALPESGLVSDGVGSVWGTTSAAGAHSCGTLFKVNLSSGAITTVADFDNSENAADNLRGAHPPSGLVSDGNGNLWGTTRSGGKIGWGTVYKVNISTGTVTTVVDFDGSRTAGDNTRGATPVGGLVSDGAGNLWGTTLETIFKINISSGVITTLVDFDNSTSPTDNARGSEPQASLLNDGAGNLWGSTMIGGVESNGTLFKVNISTGAITTIADFDGSNLTTDNLRGGNPLTALASDGKGYLWGSTSTYGVYGNGTVFRVNAATGDIVTVFDFSGSGGPFPGASPAGALLFNGTGFYGTAQDGGIPAGSAPGGGGGEVFSFSLPVPPVAENLTAVETGTGAVVIDVLAADSDPNGAALAITSLTQTLSGTAAITGTGSTITYTPQSSFAAFSETETLTYTITDSLGLSATASVTIGNPFYMQEGNFAALLYDPAGYLTLATTGTGAFTGRLRLGNLSYILKGLFPWTGTVGGKVMTLQFDVGNLAANDLHQYSISGVYDGTAFTAYHALYSTAILAPEVGTYKVLIEPPAQTGTTQATATAVVTNGVITGISITGSGLGYVSIPAVTISATSGKGAVLTAAVSNGQVTGIKVVKGGSKYPASGVTANIAQPSGNPIGNGYGTLTVTKTGAATLTGKLADGTAFTDALLITGGTGSADTAQVYVNLPYHVAGFLAGTLSFENEPGVSDLDGTLSWTKPQQVGSAVALFQGGFSLATTAIGSLYVVPKGAPALALSTTSPNATITLVEPNWSTPIVKNVTVATNNKVTVNNPGTDKLALTISAPGGAFSGSFIDPVTGKRQAFTGVLFQKQSSAGGYFVNTTESGSVSLSP
jgi:uncharacterized repeat protein (TIGR03803 family)